MTKIEVSIKREGPADVAKILSFKAVMPKSRSYLADKTGAHESSKKFVFKGNKT